MERLPIRARASGIQPAPAAGTVVADSGAISEGGTYTVEFAMAAHDTQAVGKGLVLEHRNALNTSTTHRLAACAAPDSVFGRIERVELAAGERLRIVTSTAAGAASSAYYAMVTLYPAPAAAVGSGA